VSERNLRSIIRAAIEQTKDGMTREEIAEVLEDEATGVKFETAENYHWLEDLGKPVDQKKTGDNQ